MQTWLVWKKKYGGEAPVDGGATDAPETATGGEGVPPQEGATDITV